MRAEAFSTGIYGMSSGEAACMLLPSKSLLGYHEYTHTQLFRQSDWEQSSQSSYSSGTIDFSRKAR